MSDIAPRSIRRLWVALDAVGCEAVDWGAALDLAALIGAELQGLFVEDEDLLELAALPIAHELGVSALNHGACSENTWNRCCGGVSSTPLPNWSGPANCAKSR